MPETHFLII